MKILVGIAVITMIAVSDAQAKLVEVPVKYTSGPTNLEGYMAFDDEFAGRRPGILVVHEWWGHNEYVRKRARMLAKLGYTALAVDMYGDGKQADHPDDAAAFAGSVRKNMAVAQARFQAGLDLLRRHSTVASEKIAAIGYCFGGGVVLEMARRGVDVSAVASFHGSLNTAHPARPGDVKARVLVLNGADDSFVPPEQIEAFRREMETAGAAYEIVSYPGAMHSFTNPEADAYARRFGLPLAYNADADGKSWERMLSLFREIFGR